MTNLKKGDFVELEYTGKLEDGTVFDTTDEKTAKDNGLFNEKTAYGPVTICIGQNHVLKGLDDAMEGKEIGQKLTAIVKPEDGFGRKSAQLLRMIPGHVFKRDGVEPVKGMPVNIDGAYGTVVNASGGRIIVDFNHPLAGKTLYYEVKLNRLVENDEEKLKALVKLKIGEDIKVKFNDAEKTAIVEVEQLPHEMQELLKKNFMELVPSIKDIRFEKEKEQEKKEEAKEETEKEVEKEQPEQSEKELKKEETEEVEKEQPVQEKEIKREKPKKKAKGKEKKEK